MGIEIYLKSRVGLFDAKGIYNDGIVTVKKGSRINTKQAAYVCNGQIANNKQGCESLVDENGYILAECSFSSPSTASNFVTGRSSNGYVAWRVDDKNNLGRFLGREKTKGTKQSY